MSDLEETIAERAAREFAQVLQPKIVGEKDLQIIYQNIQSYVLPVIQRAEQRGREEERKKLNIFIDEVQYLSVTAPQLYEEKELRWLWYEAIDRFRKILLKRAVEAIRKEAKGAVSGQT